MSGPAARRIRGHNGRTVHLVTQHEYLEMGESLCGLEAVDWRPEPAGNSQTRRVNCRRCEERASMQASRQAGEKG